MPEITAWYTHEGVRSYREAISLFRKKYHFSHPLEFAEAYQKTITDWLLSLDWVGTWKLVYDDVIDGRQAVIVVGEDVKVVGDAFSPI